MPRSRRRGTSAALSLSEPCQTLEDDGVTRCSKPGTRVSGVNPPKRRCRLHHKQYIQMYKDYKEAGEIVKSFEDTYLETLPDNAQILTCTDYRTCEEWMELLQEYVEAVRREKDLREVHRRFFLETDEGHLHRLKVLTNKISSVEERLDMLRTRVRVLSHAAMTIDDYARLESTSKSHGTVATDLEAQREISVPESYLQAPIHHAPVDTTTSSQTVTPEAWPTLNASTSASASASSSTLTSTVSPASVSTTRASPHDQTPLLSHSQLDYASAARRGRSGKRRGRAVVYAAMTTHSPSSAAVPSTPAPTFASRTSQPAQSSHQYLYTYPNPQYSQYPEYNNSNRSIPAPTPTPTSRTSQPVQSSYQYQYTYSNPQYPQYPEYNRVYNSTDDSQRFRRSQVPDPERNCTESPPSPPPSDYEGWIIFISLVVFLLYMWFG